MSDQLVPTGPSGPYGETQLQSWQESRLPAVAPPKSSMQRPVAAVRRYKWLIIAITLVATSLGFLATRYLTPQYEVRASILIASEGPMENRSGPIRSAELLPSDDWGQLLKSYAIADDVVRKLALYLQPADKADAPLFKGFGLADAFHPGKYELDIDRDNKKWTVLSQPAAASVDAGTQADSVGRRLGFLWQLPPWAFTGSGIKRVKFTVATPRETSVKLVARLGTQRREQSNFMLLTLQDPDRQLAANILNTWSREFVSAAADLKRRKLVEFARTLDGQLQIAKGSLDSAENQLQSFKVKTITQPSEGGPIAAGVQETRDPVVKNYFDKKIEYDDVKHDVSLLQTLIAQTSKDSVPSEALLQIRSVAMNAPVANTLRQAVSDYHVAEAQLAAERVKYTDEHPTVKNLIDKMNDLKTVKIPQAARELLRSLQSRQADDSSRIAGAGQNLQEIPQRTIQEEQLRRTRDVAAGLYTNLQNRYAEAQLAEESATPDVSVLDSAIAPLAPTANTAPRVIMMAIIGGIAAAIGLAILLDMLDGRLRYPDQVTDEIGLPIAGTVPRFPKGGANANSPEQMFQLVESFRTLRMAVVNSQGAPPPISLSVSSPSPGDGKSLISANLAMSFADAGLRTILVDGDTRRGALHEMFDLGAAPGLTDYLAGRASQSEVIRPTSDPMLSVIPCGRRQRRSPEMLTSPLLPRLVADLRAAYDVVLFDTPPLAAGIDGYSIASATGNLLLVLRVGKTERRMTSEKLRVFDRLPVNIVGAVLNGIQLTDGYEYYGYVPGYEARDDAPSSALAEIR